MKSIMTHIVAGYPNLKISQHIAEIMLQNGVSFLEIQIPFSDPVADGPVIMHANQKALDQGITPEDCFKLMKRLSKKTNTPLLFMTYFNILYTLGVDMFCKKAKLAGAYGLIVPDMPVDEESSEGYLASCKKYGLHPIQVISPLTPERRLKKIAFVASGFVYCVSRTGTTGESKQLDAGLSEYIKKIKKYISLPLALGFGISRITQVHSVFEQGYDIAVIGSKFIHLAGEKNYDKKIKTFLLNIKQ